MDLEGALTLIGRFLARQGYKETLAALCKESGLSGVANESERNRVSLAEVLDQWCEYKTFMEHNKEGHSVLLLPTLDSIGGNDEMIISIVDKIMGPCASNVLCCGFVEGIPVWGEANGTLHYGDVLIHLDRVVGGALCVASTGSLWVCGTMGGRLIVLQGTTVKSEIPNAHLKYVHRACFSPNGRWLATASHDRSVALYRVEGTTITLEDRLPGDTIPEGICFQEDDVLLIARRESCMLQRYHCGGEKECKALNMNQMGDNHVGFSVLDISLCPVDRRVVACATDRDR